MYAKTQIRKVIFLFFSCALSPPVHSDLSSVYCSLKAMGFLLHCPKHSFFTFQIIHRLQICTNGGMGYLFLNHAIQSRGNRGFYKLLHRFFPDWLFLRPHQYILRLHYSLHILSNHIFYHVGLKIFFLFCITIVEYLFINFCCLDSEELNISTYTSQILIII